MDDKLMVNQWLGWTQTAALVTFDNEQLFDEISSTSPTVEQLAKKKKYDESMLWILVRILCGTGFLELKNSKIALTETAHRFMLRASPYYWGNMFKLKSDPARQRVLDALQGKKGELLVYKDKAFADYWKEGDVPKEMAEQFTHSMHSLISAPADGVSAAKEFAKVRRLIDMGGGSGAFGQALTKVWKDMVVCIFDLPEVCKVSASVIKNEHKRIEFAGGSFWERSTWQRGDAYLYSNVFHNWGLDRCKQLAENSFELLPSGGQIFIFEMLYDDNKISPLATAMFDLLMYMNFKSQQFTIKELENLLEPVGFRDVREVKTYGYYSLVAATKP